MIDPETRLIDMKWGNVLSELDQRYGPQKSSVINMIAAENSKVFITIKECAELTQYRIGYLRQLVFRKAIPFYKAPGRKPIRFKRSEILEWISSKKFVPINEQAENYLTENESKKHEHRP